MKYNLLVTLWSGYGYSNIFLIPASIFAIYPDKRVQRVIMGFFGLISMASLIRFACTFMKNKKCDCIFFYTIILLIGQICVYFAYHLKFY
jgi:hypothetical protein